MQKRFTPDAGGVFPEWEEVTLGDIAEFSRGKGLTKKDVSEKGERKCLLYGQLQVRYGTIIKNVTGMTDVELKNPVLSKSGDVLISGTISAGLAKASCIKEDGVIIGGDINILRPKEGIDGEFLARAINANTKKFKRFLEGSVILHLKNENIKEVSIRIPKSIEEQRKIAAAFAAYDEMIAVKTAKLETWQECKKRMVKEIFGRTKRFKDDDGREFPEWEEKTLGNVSTVKRGKGYAKKDLTDKGTPIILYGRLYTKYETKIENVDTFADVQKNSIVSIGGEVIIPTSGENSEDIARAAAVEQQGVLIGGDLCVIMPNKDMFDSTFLAYAITYSKSHKDLVKKANGEIIAHLRVEDIKNLSVSLPCTEEQQKIGSFLAEIDNEIEIQKEFIKTYTDGKRRMMRELIE